MNYSGKQIGLFLFLFLGTGKGYGAQKAEIPVKEETQKRRQGTIQKTIATRTPRPVFWGEKNYELARQKTFDRKTLELINQIEALRKRPGQKSRLGELDMRLAELYFDFARSLSAREGEVWESQIKNWEALAPAVREKTPRPQLKTPKADALRKKTISLYQSLEARSRGADAGISQMIRREEVLYFLASTLIDLGQRSKAGPYLEELVSRYQKGERVFAAQANLADLYFEQKQYSKAIPLYLKVASGDALEKNVQTESLKNYSRYRLGWCYVNTGQLDKALLTFKVVFQSAQKSDSEQRRLVFVDEVLTDLAFVFALSGEFDQGEEFLSSQNTPGGLAALASFRKQAVLTAEERLQFDRADTIYQKLIDSNPKSVEARGFGWNRVQLGVRRGDFKDFVTRLEDFSKNFGAKSQWLESQPESEKQNWVTDLVGTLRREAKNQHRLAQTKKADIEYQKAARLYELYFKFVPNPNADTQANLNDMYFYSGEIAFRLGDFSKAADDYKKVETTHAQGASAAYGRVLALQKISEKSPSEISAFVKAVDEFTLQYPNDPRGADLLYLSASEAFKTGESEESIASLNKVISRFSAQKIGVEAAERILFILEKQKRYDEVAAESQRFLRNASLVKAGGSEFARKLTGLKNLVGFKKIEEMPDQSDLEIRQKAQSFLDFARGQKNYLSEKAYNNAWVFGLKTADSVLIRSISDEFISKFPKSEFLRSPLLKRAEMAIAEADFEQALKLYEEFHKNFGSREKPTGEGEAALWNIIFIRSHLEGVSPAVAFPIQELSKDLEKYLDGFFKKFPGSRHRLAAAEIYLFRKKASLPELQRLQKELIQSSDLKALFQEAEVVLSLRSMDGKKTPPKSFFAKYGSVKPTTVRLAAALGRRSFETLESDFISTESQKLDYKPAQFVKSLSQKLSRLENLEKEYLKVVAFGYPETALKSLERLSRLFRSLADDIYKAPAKKEDLAEFANPLTDKAKGFLKRCLDKASELKVGGEVLRSCRDLAARENLPGAELSQEKLPKLGWLPLIDPRLLVRPQLRVLSESVQSGQWSKAQLALEISRGDFPQLNPSEKAVFHFLEGLIFYRFEKTELSAQSLRLAFEGAQDAGIAKAARKNLGALYLEVGDTQQAFDLLDRGREKNSFGDSDEALIFGLSARGEGDVDLAISAYEAGLSQGRNQPLILYNLALALGATGTFREASKYMSQYIELARPSAQDLSRTLLTKWKAQSRQSLPESEL